MVDAEKQACVRAARALAGEKCLLQALALAVALSACGGSETEAVAAKAREPAAQVETGSTVAGPSATIGEGGGRLEGAAGTPLEGVRITVPPGAFAVNTSLALGHNTGGITPVAGRWAGPIVELTTDYDQEFDAPLEITLPFDAAAGELPIPFYLEPDGELQYIDPITVDRENHEVTFQTWHASSFAYLLARADDPLADAYDTGFDPELHGFQIRNAGSFYNASGECMGMAAWASWYSCDCAPAGKTRWANGAP
jgi:hypothetical protein